MIWVTAVKVRGRKAEKANETPPKKLKMNSNECLVIISLAAASVRSASEICGTLQCAGNRVYVPVLTYSFVSVF